MTFGTPKLPLTVSFLLTSAHLSILA